MLVPARSLLSFWADQRVGAVCYFVITSCAHEVFDEKPERHFSFLSSPGSISPKICLGLAVHQLSKCSKKVSNFILISHY